MLSAAKRILLQLFYEARLTAIVLYKRTKADPAEAMTKKRAIEEKIQLTKEQYLEVSNMCLLLLIDAIFVYLLLKRYFSFYLGSALLVRREGPVLGDDRGQVVVRRAQGPR